MSGLRPPFLYLEMPACIYAWRLEAVESLWESIAFLHAQQQLGVVRIYDYGGWTGHIGTDPTSNSLSAIRVLFSTTVVATHRSINTHIDRSI